MARARYFIIWKELDPRRRRVFQVFSFIIPLAVWSLVSYCPAVWHPMVRVSDPGSIGHFRVDAMVQKGAFYRENAKALAEHRKPAQGVLANPVYLPAPHEVAKSFYKAFVTPPRLPEEPWLHESLWHSIKIIIWGFLISSVIAVPLGILAGTYRIFSYMTEPFVEFFRYLPAPAFAALSVAVLGIYDGPKVAIIVIGTFFQQVLMISNTTQRLDPALLEAAQTLGARGLKLFTRVVIPGILPDVYRDMRILLGWAWTYLIVAEVVGNSTGITWFINQQAKYRIYDNVYAAIIMIGIIGITTDIFLAWLGSELFVWKSRKRSILSRLRTVYTTSRTEPETAQVSHDNA
ncbi:MAG: nitrate ABC transporter permease [Geobacter sp.]|nr:MAG: nitrate ABC transporter permease [Geobacter sp.]